MKVLMINSVCGIRSTGRICTDLAELLEEKGHICKIAYGREAVPEKYERFAVRIGSELGVKLHGVKARLLDAAGFGSRSDTKKFIEWVKTFEPDVIHLHNIHGYYINVELLFEFLKEYGRPVVWTLHDEWAFTGHCAYTSGCDRWSVECDNCPRISSYPASLTENSRSNFIRKRTQFCNVGNMVIVTPSQWLAGLVGQSYLSDYKTVVINNGIDTESFKPTDSDFRAKHGLEDKKIILGVASAWGRGKGFYDFIKLSERLPDSCKVVMVGVTEKQKNELPDKILAITRTNNVKELAEIYTAADVFVNLTYDDNYPTVNLEAQACGTPAVTYRTGGSVESVADECIVEQGDIQGVIDLLDKALECKKELSFDKKDMLRQYAEIYEKVCEGGR